jgi:hypothetical protein
MDRVRTVLCSLLPALWVLGAEPCLADPAAGRINALCRAAFSAAHQGDPTPLTDARTLEPSARLSKRRTGAHMGWGGIPAPVAVPAFGLGALARSDDLLLAATDALGLAKCWQFYWRTASQPRAPSSVS